MRSRFKKREEVETLELLVRKLEQEKAMMELENVKLKQQNELFMQMLSN